MHATALPGVLISTGNFLPGLMQVISGTGSKVQ